MSTSLHINSTEMTGLFPPTNTSDAQLHAAQLDDYQRMLSLMNEPANTVNPSNLLSITPFSPIHRASEEGLNTLWHLLRDRSFIDMCHQRQIKQGYMSVTLVEGIYVYQGSSISGEMVTFDLTENPTWEARKPEIEKAANLLGGQLNANRMITLARMSGFYGLAPWRPRHPQEHPAAILALEEKIAHHHLHLEDDFDILELRRRPTDTDRATFRASRRQSPSDSEVDIHLLHAAIIRTEIIDLINEFLPDKLQSPLTYLGSEILAGATDEQVRATPTVYLQKILHSAKAEQLGVLLLSQLDWYGGEIGEQTSPYIRTRLIAQALQLWLTDAGEQQSGEIAGYDWQARSNWGKSYPAMRAEFERHLLTSKRATGEKEAVVIARLFLSQFPSEFRVSNIPAYVSYRSSIVWVNFVNGVNLIMATDPRMLDRLTFQQLANLTAVLSDKASAQTLNFIALTRLLPAMDWARTCGIIADKAQDQYTRSDAEQALTALDTHAEELNQAAEQLNKKAPERLAIAKKEMARLFGPRAFIDDGRKLARPQPGPLPLLLYSPYRERYDYYSFLDVFASDKFDDQKRWFVTEANGSTMSTQWIRIDEQRTIKTRKTWFINQANDATLTERLIHYYVLLPLKLQKPSPLLDSTTQDGSWVLSPTEKLPNVNALFDQAFAPYLQQTTRAYEILIRHLLASLPHADRQALEYGAVTIYSLRQPTKGVEAALETAKRVDPLRARNGLVLRANHASNTTYYELLPKAGVIRRIALTEDLLGAQRQTERWKFSKGGSVSVTVLRNKDLPFDWDAHNDGSAPKENARCQAIIEQLGETLAATAYVEESPYPAAQTLSSDRSMAISQRIASQLLFVDPKTLRKAANGQTPFDRDDEFIEKIGEFAKALVPFWGSLEDLDSNDPTRMIKGAFGLYSDGIAFMLPIGKFITGSMRLVNRTSNVTLRPALPSFKQLTIELLTSIIGILNPLDGVFSLLRNVGTAMLKLTRAGRFKLKELLGRAGHYQFIHSRPRIRDHQTWKPLAPNDELARVNGVDDVPVRNLTTAGKSDYRLIDPQSSKLFGPTLATKSGAFSPGRSSYRSLKKTDEHLVFKVPEHTRIHELPEADGRTTMLLDGVAYRLDGDSLRRVDLIDDHGFKAMPCRLPRAPGQGVCQTQYVVPDEAAPTPTIGHYDETKGWALWFGDVIYLPTGSRQPMNISNLARHDSLMGTIEFQKGIFGGVAINVPIGVPSTPKTPTDVFKVGAVIVEAMDGSKHYVYTRLNGGDFFVAERIKGQAAQESLNFKKAETLEKKLKEPNELQELKALNEELRTVYIGSLNANNTARIHGIEAVERAIETMDRIAISIGGPANPPATLTRVRVDTSPGEAVLFDHDTRMIVKKKPEGATTWSRSTEAPEAFRRRTVEIFDTLFLSPTIRPSEPEIALRINKSMTKLKELLSPFESRPNARNIAYADVTTVNGTREVYVSVSGAQGSTKHLPLFRHLGANHVRIGETTYINIDYNLTTPMTSLKMTDTGKMLAVPYTIDNIKSYTSDASRRPTSLDSESKLINTIREKYPDLTEISTADIATTMAPCESCSVVLKEFGHDGGADALQVLWG